MIVAHNDEAPKLWNLHGHTHSKEKFEECGSYNVAVDAHNCFPVSIEQIIKDFGNYDKFKNQFTEAAKAVMNIFSCLRIDLSMICYLQRFRNGGRVK